MNSEPFSFDPTWEEIYRRGEQLNRYPYDSVVTFVFRHVPRGVPLHQLRVLEIGCGGGNNLWFCAREGMQVTGIDASETAIEFALRRFAAEGLAGDLRVGDFTRLKFANDSFDLAINRAATTQVGRTLGKAAAEEVRRVLKPGGFFFSEIYSDRSSSRGRRGPDGVLLDIQGPLAGVGQVCLYSRRDLEELFDGWSIESIAHVEQVEMSTSPFEVMAYWRAVTIKP